MKIVFVLVILSFGNQLKSQNIIDLVCKLSEKTNIPTDTVKLNRSINYYEGKLDSLDYFDLKFTEIDIKNGYLKGVTPDSEVSLCFWNMSNGKKLICYNLYYCGPVCSSEWYFYEYSTDKGITESPQRIIPNNYIKLSDYFDFDQMKMENSEVHFKELEKDAYLTFTLELPKKGVNPILYFKPNLVNGLKYKLTFSGIELIWKDGIFEKGNWIN